MTKIYYERDLFLRALWDFKGQWTLYTHFKILLFYVSLSVSVFNDCNIVYFLLLKETGDHVHSSVSHNGQEVEATQVSIDGLMSNMD